VGGLAGDGDLDRVARGVDNALIERDGAPLDLRMDVRATTAAGEIVASSPRASSSAPEG